MDDCWRKKTLKMSDKLSSTQHINGDELFATHRYFAFVVQLLYGMYKLYDSVRGHFQEISYQ